MCISTRCALRPARAQVPCPMHRAAPALHPLPPTWWPLDTPLCCPPPTPHASLYPALPTLPARLSCPPARPPSHTRRVRRTRPQDDAHNNTVRGMLSRVHGYLEQQKSVVLLHPELRSAFTREDFALKIRERWKRSPNLLRVTCVTVCPRHGASDPIESDRKQKQRLQRNWKFQWTQASASTQQPARVRACARACGARGRGDLCACAQGCGPDHATATCVLRAA